MSLVSHRKESPGTKVIKKRGRPPKKNAAKSKAKFEGETSKKRSASKSVEDQRAAKVLKKEPRANIGKKVDIRNAILATVVAHEIIDLTSDSESDEAMLRHAKQAHPSPRPEGTIVKDVDWSVTTAQKEESTYDEDDLRPDSATSVKNDRESSSAVELHKVRSDLQVTREEMKKLLQDTEKREANFQLQRTKSETETRQQIYRLTKELEAEWDKSRTLTAEQNQLREQVQRSEVAKVKCVGLENELRSLQGRYDKEKKAREEEQQTHANILEDIIQSTSKEDVSDGQSQANNKHVQKLEDDNARLTKEVQALKAVPPFRSVPTLSPVPSLLPSTDDDRRDDNIRKMFIKTKRQYDVLYSAASNVAACTRSLDVSSFGDFGRYSKKLRVVLEIDKESQGGDSSNALVIRKSDDEDD
ncbi:hypothetical protein EK21DRAFT_117172 [Setomelanomma holmii]|uniref:Uncharacterized protein n=1 Tax=Setomelanomma holmii TaxID=210430 RepID=A0A9P4LHY3_9PLEO|nr:hypothetical protein EK21DRAFT_117172 [Setomelanomma holmii]